MAKRSPARSHRRKRKRSWARGASSDRPWESWFGLLHAPALLSPRPPLVRGAAPIGVLDHVSAADLLDLRHHVATLLRELEECVEAQPPPIVRVWWREAAA